MIGIASFNGVKCQVLLKQNVIFSGKYNFRFSRRQIPVTFKTIKYLVEHGYIEVFTASNANSFYVISLENILVNDFYPLQDRLKFRLKNS